MPASKGKRPGIFQFPHLFFIIFFRGILLENETRGNFIVGGGGGGGGASQGDLDAMVEGGGVNKQRSHNSSANVLSCSHSTVWLARKLDCPLCGLSALVHKCACVWVYLYVCVRQGRGSRGQMAAGRWRWGVHSSSQYSQCGHRASRDRFMLRRSPPACACSCWKQYASERHPSTVNTSGTRAINLCPLEKAFIICRIIFCVIATVMVTWDLHNFMTNL